MQWIERVKFSPVLKEIITELQWEEEKGDRYLHVMNCACQAIKVLVCYTV